MIDYASRPPHRQRVDPLRDAPLVAAVLAGLALLKSSMCHGHGQLRDEQIRTVVFATLSLPCLMLAVVRYVRRWCHGRRKRVAATLPCVFVLGCDAIALWNLRTATAGAKRRLF